MSKSTMTLRLSGRNINVQYYFLCLFIPARDFVQRKQKPKPGLTRKGQCHVWILICQMWVILAVSLVQLRKKCAKYTSTDWRSHFQHVHMSLYMSHVFMPVLYILLLFSFLLWSKLSCVFLLCCCSSGWKWWTFNTFIQTD